MVKDRLQSNRQFSKPTSFIDALTRKAIQVGWYIFTPAINMCDMLPKTKHPSAGASPFRLTIVTKMSSRISKLVPSS